MPVQTRPWPADDPRAGTDPRVEALVTDLIGRVADKWTMLVLDLLAERGTLRFTEVSRAVPAISQKMLTQTLRAMERDGLLTRKVHPVVPPKVEYRLTALGLGLGEAFCGVWIWAEAHLGPIEAARAAFDEAAASRRPPGVPPSDLPGVRGVSRP